MDVEANACSVAANQLDVRVRDWNRTNRLPPEVPDRTWVAFLLTETMAEHMPAVALYDDAHGMLCVRVRDAAECRFRNDATAVGICRSKERDEEDAARLLELRDKEAAGAK